MRGFKKGYCKYCYKHVPLVIDYDEDLIKCLHCGYGLAPWSSAKKHESFNKWLESISVEFFTET